MDKLFYIPASLPSPGTLPNQIVYSHSFEHITLMKSRQLLKWVIEKHEKDFDSVNGWNDVLPGGEKQRITMPCL